MFPHRSWNGNIKSRTRHIANNKSCVELPAALRGLFFLSLSVTVWSTCFIAPLVTLSESSGKICIGPAHVTPFAVMLFFLHLRRTPTQVTQPATFFDRARPEMPCLAKSGPPHFPCPRPPGSRRG